MSEFHEITARDLVALARISNSKPFADEEGRDPFADRFFSSKTEELNEFLRFKAHVEDWLAAREAAFRLLAGERVLIKGSYSPYSPNREVLIRVQGNEPANNEH